MGKWFDKLRLQGITWGLVWLVGLVDNKDYLYQLGEKLLEACEKQKFFKFELDMQEQISNLLIDFMRGLFVGNPKDYEAYIKRLKEE